jgi:hypothetical protein
MSRLRSAAPRLAARGGGPEAGGGGDGVKIAFGLPIRQSLFSTSLDRQYQPPSLVPFCTVALFHDALPACRGLDLRGEVLHVLQTLVQRFTAKIEDKLADS